MRSAQIRASLLRRITDRANLLVLFLVGGLFCIFRLFSRGPRLTLFELVLPFVLLFAHLALSPVPWQWTGNDESRVGPGRGFLQALFFNACWVALLLGLLHLLGLLQPGPPPPGQGGPPRPGLPNLGLALVNVAFAIAFGWVFSEKEATEAKQLQTADLLRQSRSRSLQNQLDPHVLFNALNSLTELVHEDPLAAEEVIVRLADLYRMLTVHGRAERVPLAQERLLVEAYLSMEQMRLGERLQIQWQWPPWADGVEMPPLFLQPLVENAIKHGISPSDAGGILVIECLRDDQGTALVVRNTGTSLMPDASRGVGIGNLEARLELWTEVMGHFKLEIQDGWTVATVRWSLRKPA